MEKQRNSGFELLRVIAMFGIIVFHHFGTTQPNNFVELTNGFGQSSYYYDFINNAVTTVRIESLFLDFCYGHFGDGGNLIFMLLTGYYLFDREYTCGKAVKKVGSILLTIVFYGFVLVIYNFIYYKCVYQIDNSYKPIFNLPNWFSGQNLWYLQAYGVFILIVLPLLKKIDQKLDKEKHLYLALTLILINFLAWNEYLPYFWISNRLLCFIMCYYVGGYISKYKVNPSRISLVVLSVLYLFAFFAYEYYWRKLNFNVYAPNEYSYIDVCAPFICTLCYAVLMILIFQKIQFHSKVVNIIASTIIGIYIFHYSTYVSSFHVANVYWWQDWSLDGFCIFVVLNSLILFWVGFWVDILRQYMFKMLNTILNKSYSNET